MYTHNGPCHVVPAQRWWPMLERVCQRPDIPSAEGTERASLDGYHKGEPARYGSWAGANWTGAMTMMRDGWQDGAQAVDAIMATLPDAEALADAWNLEAAGRFPCVPAFLSGDPECMWQTVEMDGTKPRICLIVSACYHCGIESAEALRYGAAVGATLRALEAMGHGVAIYTVDKGKSWNHKEACAQATVVRDFGEPLDTSIVSFAFHPSFLRRVLFANRELTPAWAERGLAREGYGQALEANLADAVACLGEFPATPVVLSGVMTASRLGVLREGKTKELLDLFRKEVSAALGIEC
jgi:hypothetical protein